MQKYQILGVIGEGAYGIVLRCRNIETKQIVAIKKFKETQQDQIVKKTTMRQVKVLRMLNQTNIVELKQAFRKKGIVCLVFQYVHNNLLEILQKTPTGLQPELIRSFLYQLLKGLAYLHSMNIVHRDIKPENLLVSQKKVLKICDFGFARVLKKNEENEELTDYVATRWYRPPQLLVGAKYDKPIDLWAVGCLFGQLIDGMPMFPGQNQIDQLFLIQKCLGSLTSQHKQIFLKNPRFLGMKFPQITNLDSIEKRYLGKLNAKSLNFIKSLLKMNPAERLTSIQALKHPYFDGIREQQFIRKLISIQQSRTQNRIISANSVKEQPLTGNIDRKKPYINAYNPPLVQKNQEQKHFHQTLYTNKNSKFMKKKEDNFGQSTKFSNFKTNKQISQLHAKSVNKNGTIKNKHKDKDISLQKHHNKDLFIKTQGGFYLQSVENIIQEKKKQEQNQSNINNYSRNKIYGIKKSPKMSQLENISQKNQKIIVNTQQVAEYEDFNNMYQSTGQLPFIVLGKKMDKTKQYLKDKGNINIIINQNTYNYKSNLNYN